MQYSVINNVVVEADSAEEASSKVDNSIVALSRKEASLYVEYVIDDALNGRAAGADMYAKVYDHSWIFVYDDTVISCHSYLPNTVLNMKEARELVEDFLEEVTPNEKRELHHWFPPMGGSPAERHSK